MQSDRSSQSADRGARPTADCIQQAAIIMKYQHQQHYNHHRHAPPAAADALEDGLSPLLQPAKPQHQPLYYDDDKVKRHRRRGGRHHGRSSSSSPWAALLLVVALTAAGACLLVWRAGAGGEERGGKDVVARAKAAAEAFNLKTLVQQGIENPQGREEGPKPEQEQAVGTWIGS